MSLGLRRMLLLLTLALAAAGALWGIYAHRQTQIRHEALGWKAAGLEAARTGNPTTAVQQLSLYLRQYPTDVEALEAYAQARPQVSNGDERQTWQDTIFALRQLLNLQPTRVVVRRQLLELYVRAGDTTRAVEIADSLLATNPHDGQVLGLKASALMDAQDWPRAQVVLGEWTTSAPLDVEAQSAMLLVLQQIKTAPARIVSRTVDLRLAHPGDGRFELIEACALRLTDLPSEPVDAEHPNRPHDGRSAVEWLRAAAAHAPAKDPKFTHALVRQLDEVGLFDESLATLRSAVSNPPDADLRRDLARRLWEQAKWAEAAPLLQAGENADAKSSDEALAMEGLAMLQLGNAKELERIYGVLAGRANDPVAAGWRSILEHLVHPEMGNPKAWVDACRQALNGDVDNPYLCYYLAEAYDQLGETDLAITLLEGVSRRNLTWALAPGRLADLLLSSDRPDAAAQAAQEAQHRAAPDGNLRDMGIALILARAWHAQLRNTNNADTEKLHDLSLLVAAVQKALPDEEETLAIEIDLLARSGDRAGATKRLDQALHTTGPMTEAGLLHLATISHDAKLGLEAACLDRSQRDHGLGANLTYARAVLLFEQGQPRQGLSLLESTRQQSGHADALSWRIAVLRYLDLIGDPAARAQWETLADEQATNLGVQQLALVTPATRTDRPFIQRTIERLRDLTGEQGVAWRLAQARWLLQDASRPVVQAEEVSTLLNGVLRLVPDSPDAHWLLGRALLRLKNLPAAAQHLETAAMLNPSSVPIALDLAQVQQARAQTARARQTLTALADGPRATPDLLLALGHLDEQSGDIASAEASYRHALRLSPDDAGTHDTLALLLLRLDDPKQTAEALHLAIAATQASPQTPEYLHTLALAQAKAGDVEDALQTITRAISLPDSDMGCRVLQVRLLLDAGRLTDARAAFNTINPSAITDYSLRTELDSLRPRLSPSATKQTK